MPVEVVWIGGAPGAAQVAKVTIPDDIVSGLVFTAKIGDKTLDYTIPASITAASMAAAIVDLWNDSEITEFSERTAADNGDGSFMVTADEEGKPFILTVTIGGGANEKQTVTIGGNPTGGTFALSVGGQVTDPIAHNATGATVETELEALSTVGAGNVSVTGDGPYTIEFIGALAGVNVDPIGANADGLTVPPEVQVLDLGSPTGGTWTVKLGAAGTATAALAYNITAASLQTALEGLPEIGTGNASVSGVDGGPFTITFQGAFNGIDVDDLIIDGSNLTGGLADAVTITEQTAGGGGGNEVWTFTRFYGRGFVNLYGDSDVTAGTFDLFLEMTPIGGGTAVTVLNMTAIPYDVTISELQDLIDTNVAANGFSTYGKPVSVGYLGDAGTQLTAGNYWILFIDSSVGEYEATDYTVDSSGLTGGSYAAGSISGNADETEDLDRITGDYRFSVNGEYTGNIAYDATVAEITAAVEALSSVGSGNVAVEYLGGTATPNVNGGVRFTFQGDLGNQATGFACQGSVLGSSVSFTTIKLWDGAAGTSEVQRIAISGSPGSGQFGIEFGGSYSAVIAYDTTAAELEAILEAMDTIGAGGVSCSGGPFPDTAIDVTFQGGLSGTNQDMMVAVQGTLAVTADGGNPATITVVTVQMPVTNETVTASSGPNDWNTAANWDTGVLPADGDTVIVPNGPNILYGLDQSDLSLALLLIEDSDTEVGLPRRTSADEVEYLPRFLKLSADQIIIGQGSGGGSRRINLEPVNTDVVMTVYQSQVGDDDEEAVMIRSVNSTNTATLTVFDGQVGIATNPKDEAYFKKITQRGGSLNIGSDVEFEELERTGGQISVYKATLNGLLTL